MSPEITCPGCGFLMSGNALAYHYPYVHGPRPQLLPDFLQRGDGLTRCVVVNDGNTSPWSVQDHRPGIGAPTEIPRQAQLL